jgi:hypothetical protein
MNGESAVNALAIPSTFTINVVVDLSSVEAVLVRVLSAFLQITDSQLTESETPAAAVSLPAAVEASAPSPAANPVADRPKRTRRTRAEMDALRAAGLDPRKQVLAAEKEGQKAADATSVAVSPTPASAVASAPPAPAAQPAQAAFDPFGPVPAPAAAPVTGVATQEQIDALKAYIKDVFLTHPKGGHNEYTRIRALLGNPLLSGGPVALQTVVSWEAALRTHLASVA